MISSRIKQAPSVHGKQHRSRRSMTGPAILAVSSGTIEWNRSSHGTDFDNSEIASPVF